MTRLIQRITPMNQNDGNGGGGGQYVPVDITPNAETPKPPEQVPEWAQKRFDEMTAERREADRRFQEAQALNQQLLAQLAAQRAPQAPQAPQPPTFQLPEGVDPGIGQLFKAQQDFFNQQLQAQAKALETTINGRLGQVQMTQEQLQFQQAAQGYPPQVQQLAAQRMAQWRQGGYTGWNPEDALRYAYGELASTGKLQQGGQNPNQPAVRHINQPPGAMNFGAPPPPVQQTQVLPEALPDAVISKWPPEKQEAYWAERLQKTGGIDQPIINVT